MSEARTIPDDKTVYRGMRNDNWCKRGVVNFRAYMLRPPNDQFPEPEKELSLGLNPASAVDELREEHGVASLSVLKIHLLPHNLRVVADPASTEKAYLIGLPLFSTEEKERGLAITMATALADISIYIPSTLS